MIARDRIESEKCTENNQCIAANHIDQMYILKHVFIINLKEIYIVTTIIYIHISMKILYNIIDTKCVLLLDRHNYKDKWIKLKETKKFINRDSEKPIFSYNFIIT